mmetsp:Transcript_117223/g.373400  ORF Transcript_117223/g.373400 Transcript_117223/m.373400 type:complete len:245 (-) Transcript_117223:473-1207(-)
MHQMLPMRKAELSTEEFHTPLQGRHLRHHMRDKSAKYSKAERLKSVRPRRRSLSGAGGDVSGTSTPMFFTGVRRSFTMAGNEREHSPTPPLQGLSVQQHSPALRDLVPPEGMAPSRHGEVAARESVGTNIAEDNASEACMDLSTNSDDNDRRYPWQRTKSDSSKRLTPTAAVTASMALPPPKTLLHRFVDSAAFDYFSAVLIMLNAAFIGFQTDVMARGLLQDTPFAFRVGEVTFAIVFTFELL